MKGRGNWLGYTGEECSNCGRMRVEKWGNGHRICEKCDWNQDTDEYDPVPDITEEEEDDLANFFINIKE